MKFKLKLALTSPSSQNTPNHTQNQLTLPQEILKILHQTPKENSKGRNSWRENLHVGMPHSQGPQSSNLAGKEISPVAVPTEVKQREEGAALEENTWERKWGRWQNLAQQAWLDAYQGRKWGGIRRAELSCWNVQWKKEMRFWVGGGVCGFRDHKLYSEQFHKLYSDVSEKWFDEIEGFGTSDDSKSRTKVSLNHLIFPTSPRMMYFEILNEHSWENDDYVPT